MKLRPVITRKPADLQSTLRNSLYWLAGGRFAGQLVTWAITIWVMRILTPADYALMAMTMVFISLGSLIEELGMGTTITRAPELDETVLRKAFGIILGTNAVVCSGLLAGAPVLAWFYESADLTALVRLMALQSLGSALATIPRALMDRELEFRKVATGELLVALAGSGTTLALALRDHGVWALAIGSLVMAFGRAGIFNLYHPFFQWPIFDFKGMRDFITFGGTVSLERIVWYVYSQMDVLIAGKLIGAQSLGFYVVGKHLAALPVEKISPIIQLVAFSGFARIQSDRSLVGASLVRGIAVLSVFSFPVLFGMVAVAPDLVETLLGTKWTPVALPIQTYTLVLPLSLIVGVVAAALKGVGRADLSLRNVIIGSVIMITAFALGSRWGLLGLSLAWVAAYPCYFLATVIASASPLGTSCRTLLAPMIHPAIASSLMLLLVVAARGVAQNILPSAHVRLIVFVALGAAIYIGVMLVIARDSLAGAVAVIRSKRPVPLIAPPTR